MPCEHEPGVRGAEDDGESAVDERSRDHAIDLVEAVAADRDRHRGRDQHQPGEPRDEDDRRAAEPGSIDSIRERESEEHDGHRTREASHFICCRWTPVERRNRTTRAATEAAKTTGAATGPRPSMPAASEPRTPGAASGFPSSG